MSWFGGGGGGNDMYQTLNAKGDPTPLQIKMTHALKALEGTDQVQIKQRLAKCEMLTCNCFESKNKFDVYKGREVIFYGHETTACCVRQCQTMCPDCASFEFQIDYVGRDGPVEGALTMTKACSPCTFLCINRPVTYVRDQDGVLLGSIRDPCALIPANMTFQVQDENGEDMYRAESGCCQWGICLPLPCGPCRTVEFPLVDANNGNTVGEVQKSMKGCFKMCCCSFCFDDLENYKVTFGDVKDLRSRALLMALAIFIDFRYFNNANQPDDVVDGE